MIAVEYCSQNSLKVWTNGVLFVSNWGHKELCKNSSKIPIIGIISTLHKSFLSCRRMMGILRKANKKLNIPTITILLSLPQNRCPQTLPKYWNFQSKLRTAVSACGILNIPWRTCRMSNINHHHLPEHNVCILKGEFTIKWIDHVKKPLQSIPSESHN